MHYYQFNIGDYTSHTAHLDPVEDIAYRRMLDWCYMHEKPLPTDVQEVSRIIRMRNHSPAVRDVLNEFFELGEQGWFSARVLREIEHYQAKVDQASRAGKASAERRSNARLTPVEQTFNQPITINQEPITNNQEDTYICPPSGEPAVKNGLPDCQHQAVIDLYHQHLPTLRKVEVWNAARQGYLKQRWREVAAELPNRTAVDVLTWWAEFFQHIAKSKFLTGRIQHKDGRAFAADLEWILKPSNFAKIIEGKYHGV